LVIGRELWRWAKDQQRLAERVSKNLQVSKTAFNETRLEHLPSLAPTLYAAMQARPFQLPAVAFHAAVGASANGDEPGLGKTLIGLGAIVESNPQGGTFLVACPRTSVHLVWEREIERWLADAPGEFKAWVARGSRQQREEAIERFERALRMPTRPRWCVLIINLDMLETANTYQDPETPKSEKQVGPDWKQAEFETDEEYELRCRKYFSGGSKAEFKAWKRLHPFAKVNGKLHEYPALFARTWDGVVVDEAHKVLIRNSGEDTLIRRGLMQLKTSDGGLQLALSGSMMRGKPQNLWGTLNWLYPTRYSSFWAYVDTWLAWSENEYSRDIGDVLPERREAFYREMDTFLIRRTADELYKLDPSWAPPPRSYYDVWCEMGPKQKRAYNQMRDEAIANLDGRELFANGVLAEMTRLRQFADCYGYVDDEGDFHPSLPSGKFDRVVEKLEELGITGNKSDDVGHNKVVIGSQFTAVIGVFAEALRKMKIECFVLTGDTPDRLRDTQVKRWQQKGGPRVFLINTKAGGVSITLDAYADDLFVLDETWIPDDQEQLEKRVHRTSNTKHNVRIWYFLTEGTIDEDLRAITESRDVTQRQHLDGRRGVEFAKQRFNVRVIRESDKSKSAASRKPKPAGANVPPVRRAEGSSRVHQTRARRREQGVRR
jgi:SNF2 family DNA or RNA helicase